MARIVYGRINIAKENNINNNINFTLINSNQLKTTETISADFSEDNQFTAMLSDGEYSVSVHGSQGITQLGTIRVVSSFVTANIADLLNVQDAGTRVDSSNSTVYVVPRTLDEVPSPLASVNMASQKIINLKAPTEDTDAANKFYVDSKLSGTDFTYVVRTVSNIDNEVVNKTQLYDKYKTLTLNTPVAIDNAYTVFPEYGLKNEQGAIILIKPTINGSITTLEYEILQSYFDNIIITDYFGNTMKWDFINKWANISKNITYKTISYAGIQEERILPIEEALVLLLEKYMEE